MAESPMKLTLKDRRRQGCLAVPVEKWNHFAGVRQDFLGFADVIVFWPHGQVEFVQTTSATNHMARVRKIRKNTKAALLYAYGHTITVDSWDKNWELRQSRIEFPR